MKTKQIPAIIMLVAGFITCVISIFQRLEADRFLKLLLLVLICFYILGGIVKLVIDKNFAPPEGEQPDENADADIAPEEQNENEDIDSTKEEAK